MEKKKLGLWLIILGILIAIVPLIVISGYAFYGTSSLGSIGRYGPYAFLILGIIIIIIGELYRRK